MALRTADNLGTYAHDRGFRDTFRLGRLKRTPAEPISQGKFLYEPKEKMAKAGISRFMVYVEGTTIRLYTEHGAEFARYDFAHTPTKREIASYLSRFTDVKSVHTERRMPVPNPPETPAKPVVSPLLNDGC